MNVFYTLPVILSGFHPLSFDRELTRVKEAAKSLKTLLSTKELTSAMRNVLIVETRRQQANNAVCTRNWFKNFKSKEEYLSDTQVQRLASLTQYWALDPVDSEVLAKNVRSWTSKPAGFWGTIPNSACFIERCLRDVQIIEDKSKLNPIRRRVVLVLLSEFVEEEILRVRAGLRAQGPIKHRSQAIRNIINQEYLHLSSEELKAKTEQLTRAARYGGRWLQIKNTETIIGLPSKNSKRFGPIISLHKSQPSSPTKTMSKLTLRLVLSRRVCQESN